MHRCRQIFGHPVHPMLVHFPIVFWTVAVGVYVASAAGLTESINAIAKFANAAGLIMAMLAMIAGLLELRTIDSRSDAMRVATWHMLVMATVWVRFLVALVLSISPELAGSTVRLAVVTIAVLGFLLMAVGGWLGGRLVYEFGIAVKYRG
jgi:uncharacterized membrane protein